MALNREKIVENNEKNSKQYAGIFTYRSPLIIIGKVWPGLAIKSLYLESKEYKLYSLYSLPFAIKLNFLGEVPTSLR